MNIKELRNLTGLSQSKFAEKYNINIKTLRNWEQDISKTPLYVLNLLEKAILENSREDYGKWLDETGKPTVKLINGIPNKSCWCSKCGQWLVASDEYPVFGNFCPNCGYKMMNSENI